MSWTIPNSERFFRLYYVMNFEFQTSPNGTLKVIKHLPNQRVAILEGLNGIGKTLAVRLLQLCTGTAPYRTTSEPWNSLRAGLGEFRIIATDLHGAESITWSGNTHDWLEMSPDESAWSLIDVSIDGLPSTVAEVVQILAVERIAGDEGILEMLSGQIEAQTVQLERWRARYTSHERGPLTRLEEAAEAAQLAIEAPDAEHFSRLRQSAETLKSETDQEVARAEDARTRWNRLEEATRMRTRLSDADNIAPELDAKIETVESNIENENTERADIYRSITEVAAEAAFAEPQRRELRNARRALQRNREDLASWLRSAATHAADLRIAADWPSLRQLEREADEMIRELEAHQHELDAAPAMRQLLETAIGDLTDAESIGLASQIAIDDPDIDLKLTVIQTRLGMSIRHDFLEGQPPPPEVLEVQQQLDEFRAIKQTCRRLATDLSECERHERLVEKNDDRVNAALAMADPEAAGKLRDLEAQLRAVDDRIQDLSASLAGLRHQRGMLVGESSYEALRAQFESLLSELSVVQADLEDELEQANSLREIQQARVAVLTAQLAESQRALARGEADLRRAATALLTSNDLAWVRAALPDHLIPSLDFSVDQIMDRMDQIRLSVGRLTDRLANLRIEMAAVTSGLRSVSEHLQEQELKNTDFDEAAINFYDRRFSEWFTDPSVRQILLPDSEGPVSVDLRELSVRWSEQSVEHSRPLEAFSSGEQAFAYTRARLAALDQVGIRPANRLIVLDEFGAFIAHDRLQKLLDYLRSRADDHSEDQVLIILPLSRDYDAMAKASIDDVAHLYEGYAEQVRALGYAVRVEVE